MEIKRTVGEPITLCVTGSRYFNEYDLFCRIMDTAISDVKIERIISGGCRGTDYMAVRYCFERKIRHDSYRAKWTKYGIDAGKMRNAEMARKANATIAFIKSNSRGTWHMIRMAERHKHEAVLKFKV